MKRVLVRKELYKNRFPRKEKQMKKDSQLAKRAARVLGSQIVVGMNPDDWAEAEVIRTRLEMAERAERSKRERLWTFPDPPKEGS